jgi:hypothetical protein
MTVTIDITQSAVLTVLGNFLASIVPAGTEIVIGQQNNVPEPTSPNFVIMTPMLPTRLDTTTDTYDYAANQFSQVSTQITVQCDFHGPAGGDNVTMFTTLFRDPYGCDFFSNQTIAACQPLYTSDPRQQPFINGEANYEYTWTVDAEIQFNPTITVTQQFANTLSLTGVLQVDATYPP